MTRERKTQVATLIVLAAAFGLVIWQRFDGRLPGAPGAQPRDASPQDAIYAMLDAAREGDVKAYLSYYTGQMADSLRQSLAESSEAEFGRYLRETNAPIKGVALTEPERLTDREVRVRVEYVYQDRNEAQLVYLEKGAESWKISRVDRSERVKTLIPYGTPVE